MKKCEKHLLIFFAGTLAWTWTIGMIPVILGINNTDYGNLIFVFTAGIAPSSMGLIMVFATYSPEAKKIISNGLFQHGMASGLYYSMPFSFWAYQLPPLYCS